MWIDLRQPNRWWTRALINGALPRYPKSGNSIMSFRYRKYGRAGWAWKNIATATVRQPNFLKESPPMDCRRWCLFSTLSMLPTTTWHARDWRDGTAGWLGRCTFDRGRASRWRTKLTGTALMVPLFRLRSRG